MAELHSLFLERQKYKVKETGRDRIFSCALCDGVIVLNAALRILLPLLKLEESCMTLCARLLIIFAIKSLLNMQNKIHMNPDIQQNKSTVI